MLKVANSKDKVVIKSEFNDHPTLSTEMIFPGLNREREMSAMISALTHIVSGDVPTQSDGDIPHHNSAIEGRVAFATNINNNMSSPSTTQSLSSPSSSSNYATSSSLKRTREDDSFVGDFQFLGGSSPALPTTSKHHIKSFSSFFNLFFVLTLPTW